MTLNTDDILRIDNFEQFNKQELLEIINILQNETKFHKYRKDESLDTLQSTINVLNTQINELNNHLGKVKQANMAFKTLFVRDLTIKERLTGKINLSYISNDK